MESVFAGIDSSAEALGAAAGAFAGLALLLAAVGTYGDSLLYGDGAAAVRSASASRVGAVRKRGSRW